MKTISDWRYKKLSLAIRLIDNFTGNSPLGAVNLSLSDEKNKAVKNPSGYFLFLNLAKEAYTLHISSNYYLDESFEVNLTSLDAKNPVKEIVLKPKPEYPFPSGSTLIRGTVINQKEMPMPNVKVEISEKAINSLTTEKGEYLLYFPALKDSDIKKEKGKRYIKTEGNKKLRVKATLNNLSATVTLKENLEEGSTASAPTIKLNIT